MAEEVTEGLGIAESKGLLCRLCSVACLPPRHAAHSHSSHLPVRARARARCGTCSTLQGLRLPGWGRVVVRAPRLQARKRCGAGDLLQSWATQEFLGATEAGGEGPAAARRADCSTTGARTRGGLPGRGVSRSPHPAHLSPPKMRKRRNLLQVVQPGPPRGAQLARRDPPGGGGGARPGDAL